ncbi:olfactory receptor 478-like [Ornithorhynchus anatinus]|uniref:Olfactory receptor n=1 Tax=Ornithorhynchus anatinus TaxID=9258 RepID=A0A6I8PMM7_ORNAN|nr:olfactory receptor 478-like [Ornithorhynchus anatinus]XP_039767344.1 olfactory receptor 478-like [Ornithorhynchus anatinus]
MADGNDTSMKEFIILGLTDDPVLRIFLFTLFLVVYVVTVVGNLSIIILIRASSQLHMPMYHFLSHLAFIDFWYSSTVTPKMLKGFLVERDTISFSGCVAQLCSVFVFGTSEGILLAVMAYDRFVAICNPLLYTISMSNKVCAQLTATSYVGGCLNSMLFTICVLGLAFCRSNEINHFFCDFPPLVELACSDVYLVQIISSISAAIIILSTVLTIVISYVHILCAIVRIQATGGRQKAFSTCTSHLTAVILYYGTIAFTYVQPSSSHSLEQNKVVSLFYTVVIPMLNPLIYTLRNKDVKGAALRIIDKYE